VTFRPSSPRKRPRWLALFAIVILATGAFASTAFAVTFSFVPDVQGANDVPGQKDLTAQASAFDGSTFYTAWKWDDTSWSGKNTGDGCSLFDTDGDGLVNYAVCATVTGKTPALLSVTTYSCGDGRPDRCTNPTLLLTDTTSCTITNNVAGPFDSSDTQATCNISTIATAISVPALGNATLLNTCSYPSQEPNSDPSDCVVVIANQDVVVSTQSGGSAVWTATLTDTATLAPSGATGSVVFKLYSDIGCNTLVWTSGSDSTVPFEASHDVTGPTSGTATYYWIAEYTPTGAFNSDSSACGEAVTLTAPGVSGSSGS
jgi:hypothetical protein